jgi:alkylhydroperoxidase family enzyme
MKETRIPALPEAEWDDEARSLIQLPWVPSTEPTNGAPFFHIMVHHRRLFGAWNEFGRTVFNGELSKHDRELVILRTAFLTQGRYPWSVHQRTAQRELGLTDEDIRRTVAGADAPGWSEREAALLRAADELHDSSEISDATWGVLRANYDDRQLIEIPILVGQYHIVAFFANTMRSEPPDDWPKVPDKATPHDR